MDIVLSSSYYSYLPVPPGYQIMNHLTGRFLIIYSNGRHSPVICKGIGHHSRRFKILRKTMNHSGMACNINDTVHPDRFQFLKRRIQDRMITAFIVVPGIAPSGIQTQIFYNSPVSFFLTAAHNSIHYFRCCKLCNILRYNPNCLGFLVSQSLSDIIGPVPPLFHGIQYSLSGFFTDLWLTVQNV